MPIYEYEHEQPDPSNTCDLGLIFEVEQSISEDPLRYCPLCGGNVKKIISLTIHRSPHSDRELRDQGFSKLVKREDGVYENVTAREGESKVVRADDMASMASLKPTLGD